MASEYADIPRYLRRKSGGENVDDGWDSELEKANKILHVRIARMHRDKLCEECACFDWLRTHFYTRQVYWTNEADEAAGQKIKTEHQRNPYFADYIRQLVNVQDDVEWSQFEIVAGARPEAKWLARDPRFHWQLRYHQSQQCKLCKSLWNKVETMPRMSKIRDRRNATLLNVVLMGGPVFEDGENHQCVDVWPELETDGTCGTNSFVVCLWGEGDAAFGISKYCIRPFIDGTPDLSDELLHFCLRKRQVNETGNFNLVKGWLRLCDETHRHTTGPIHPNPVLKDLRFIDTKKRCVVKQEQHVCYAALSYTWGRGEKYSLKRDNVEVLEEYGSLDRTDIALQKVIIDAIEVCTKADIPYLWVDALCIIQDDVQGKMSQIRNMDSIYSNAYVTIIQAVEKQAHLDQSPLNWNVCLGLPGLSTPFTQIEPSFVIDGMSYLVDNNDVYRTMNESFSTSRWSSRGWTFQELALSHRILLFMPQEVVFYCSNGVACESVCLGNDLYRSLPPMKQPNRYQESIIQICGFLHKSPMKNTTVAEFVEQYEADYIQLLSFYIGRSLTYETDVINAFSGIINSQSISLGRLEAGMPLRLFARALFLYVPLSSSPLSRRRGFPSWSWTGWKLDVSAPRTVLHDGGRVQMCRAGYWTLVQIYLCAGSEVPDLLLGPLDLDNGVEGYCTRSIELYNKLIPAPPLPTEPCVKEVPFFDIRGHDRALQLLVFWTHVARLDLTFPTEYEVRVFPEVHIDCPKMRARFKEEKSVKLEVVLVAITRGISAFENGVRVYPWHIADTEQEFSGIIIERWRGLARRVGVAHSIGIGQWVAAYPRKELLLLA